MTVDEIQVEAERLPLQDRGTLVSRLILSLGDPRCEVEDTEVALRARELESGEVEDISHEELLRRLRHVPPK